MATVQYTSITDEVLDFLVSGPTPEQIIVFHASERAQDRLRTLLDINRSGTLTAEQMAELDEMNRINHFFTLIKARAMKLLKDRATVAHE
jgi:hypothetical protein